VAKELNKLLMADSYWGTRGSAADVVKADKKGPKPGAKPDAMAGAKAGVKVGAKKGKKTAKVSKDPRVAKAQQAAKQLLAAKKVWCQACGIVMAIRVWVHARPNCAQHWRGGCFGLPGASFLLCLNLNPMVWRHLDVET